MPGYNPDLKGPDGTSNTPAIHSGKEALTEVCKRLAILKPTSQHHADLLLTRGTDLHNEFSAIQQMWQNVLGINVKLNDIVSPN